MNLVYCWFAEWSALQFVTGDLESASQQLWSCHFAATMCFIRCFIWVTCKGVAFVNRDKLFAVHLHLSCLTVSCIAVSCIAVSCVAVSCMQCHASHVMHAVSCITVSCITVSCVPLSHERTREERVTTSTASHLHGNKTRMSSSHVRLQLLHLYCMLFIHVDVPCSVPGTAEV